MHLQYVDRDARIGAIAVYFIARGLKHLVDVHYGRGRHTVRTPAQSLL